MLRLIQSAVGGAQERLRGVGMLRIHCHSNRNCHSVQAVGPKVRTCFAHQAPQLLRSFKRGLKAQVRKNRDKFLAAISAEDVLSSHRVLKDSRYLAENTVACVVAKVVIEFLEVINIYHEESDRRLLPVRAA